MPRWNKANVSNLVVRNSMSGPGVDQWKINSPGMTYHVDRNVDGSGDGTSWSKAFKTITEAITQVNTDYTAATLPSNGRNATILIGEGWYSETAMTLSASDVTVIGVGAGSNMADGVVLYGSLTTGGWDAGALAPILTVTGSSNTFQNMSFMNSASGLYSCVSIGSSGVTGPVNNAFYGCNWGRDVADAYTYALVDYGNEGMVVKGCRFSQSAKTAAILIASNGVVNPVNDVIQDCVFMGGPTGISQTAGHNTIITHNIFMDTTDDRAETMDAPCNIAATSALMFENIAMGTNLAGFNAGAAGTEMANFASDSDDETWPAA